MPAIWKRYCHIWYQHPRFCVLAKFHEKTKMPKFGTKNLLVCYFWARILKNCCNISNQHPQIGLFAKFHEKQECLNLGQKMPHLGFFGLKCENNSVTFECSTLKFV